MSNMEDDMLDTIPHISICDNTVISRAGTQYTIKKDIFTLLYYSGTLLTSKVDQSCKFYQPWHTYILRNIKCKDCGSGGDSSNSTLNSTQQHYVKILVYVDKNKYVQLYKHSNLSMASVGYGLLSKFSNLFIRTGDIPNAAPCVESDAEYVIVSTVEASNGITKVKDKTVRISIPQSVRWECWKTYISQTLLSGKCWCCNFNDIEIMSFECGHVIPYILGGPNTVENLRPICKSCNLSMGSENMITFKNTYYPEASSSTDKIQKTSIRMYLEHIYENRESTPLIKKANIYKSYTVYCEEKHIPKFSENALKHQLGLYMEIEKKGNTIYYRSNSVKLH